MHRFLALSLLCCSTLAFAGEQDEELPIVGSEAEAKVIASLPLPVRRGIRSYKEKYLVEFVKGFQAKVGKEVPIVVEWKTVALPELADRYTEEDVFTNVYFKPLMDAITQITKDDDGKESLKAALKRVVIKFDKETAPASAYGDGIKFKDGVLSINWQPFVNSSDIDQRTVAIVKAVESNL